MNGDQKILITGGLGYIGSHTIVELFNKQYLESNNIKNNFEVVIIDDCSTCSDKIIPILEKMINHKIYFYKASLNDKISLEVPFKEHKFYAVIHFAGKKSVNESIEKPLFYYENNFIGTFNLIELCLRYKVNSHNYFIYYLVIYFMIILFFLALVLYMEIKRVNQMKMSNIYSQLIHMENQNFLLNICLKMLQK